MRKALKVLNLPKVICTVSIGKSHKPWHRMTAGGVIMITGVLISKATVPWFDLHLFFDLIGYAIHGLGTVPFVDYLLEEEKES